MRPSDSIEFDPCASCLTSEYCTTAFKLEALSVRINVRGVEIDQRIHGRDQVDVDGSTASTAEAYERLVDKLGRKACTFTEVEIRSKLADASHLEFNSDKENTPDDCLAAETCQMKGFVSDQRDWWEKQEAQARTTLDAFTSKSEFRRVTRWMASLLGIKSQAQARLADAERQKNALQEVLDTSCVNFGDYALCGPRLAYNGYLHESNVRILNQKPKN